MELSELTQVILWTRGGSHSCAQSCACSLDLQKMITHCKCLMACLQGRRFSPQPSRYSPILLSLLAPPLP